YDLTLAIDQNVIAGIWVGIAGDVGHASAAGLHGWRRNIEALLPGRKRKDIADSSTGRSSIRQIVPDHFARDFLVRCLQGGATTGERERTRRGKIDVVLAVIDSIGRAVVSRGDAHGYAHGCGGLKGLVEIGEGLGGPL